MGVTSTLERHSALVQKLSKQVQNSFGPRKEDEADTAEAKPSGAKKKARK